MKFKAYYMGDEARSDGDDRQHVVTLMVALSHHEFVQLVAASKEHVLSLEVLDAGREE